MILSFQTNRQELGAYLKGQHFINPDDTVLYVEKPGEGNMNFVARVKTQKESIIIKQANPFVQKYPQIAAPQERVFVETEFYRMIQKYESLASCMPLFIGMDPVNHVIALQDLGDAADYTFLYQKGKELNGSELEQLIHFLKELHAIPSDRLTNYSKNLALRTLNHEHLFVYPFLEENGFNLNQVQLGLQEIAASYKSDSAFKNTVKELGSIYLSQGDTLLHGDYYPGSWLKTKGNLKVIDPEFSFVGNREFELGIFIAHLKMSEASEKQIDSVRSQYHTGTRFNWKLCYQFTGIEVMRRIIGLAQLPLDLSLEEKEGLLKEAHAYIVKTK